MKPLCRRRRTKSSFSNADARAQEEMRKAATATSGAMSSHKPCVHTAEVLICRLCAQTVNMGMLPFVHQFWRGKPMRDETSAETGTAIQILTQEILNEIGGTVPIDLTARITARLE